MMFAINNVEYYKYPRKLKKKGKTNVSMISKENLL